MKRVYRSSKQCSTFKSAVFVHVRAITTISISLAVFVSLRQVPVARRVSMARHAPALRPEPGTAFLEPKPQVAPITICSLCKLLRRYIHLLLLDSTKSADASDLLSQLRAATKHLNGISTPPLGSYVSRRRPDRCCQASQWPRQDRASSKTARPVAHSSCATIV